MALKVNIIGYLIVSYLILRIKNNFIFKEKPNQELILESFNYLIFQIQFASQDSAD